MLIKGQGYFGQTENGSDWFWPIKNLRSHSTTKDRIPQKEGPNPEKFCVCCWNDHSKSINSIIKRSSATVLFIFPSKSEGNLQSIFF